jgi:hypothetical protein
MPYDPADAVDAGGGINNDVVDELAELAELAEDDDIHPAPGRWPDGPGQ